MQEKIHRNLTVTINERLAHNPVVALLGPRQCGKTTLAGQIIEPIKKSVYLDLENPADLAKLDDPLAFFSLHENELICLDEIQRVPELFATLRSVVDERGRNGQIKIGGGAGKSDRLRIGGTGQTTAENRPRSHRRTTRQASYGLRAAAVDS